MAKTKEKKPAKAPRRGKDRLPGAVSSRLPGAEPGTDLVPHGETREEIRITRDGDVRSVTVGKKVVGAVAPVEGATPGQPLMVTNTKYWMGPDITVARALKGKVRDFGRVWNLDGRSAEICQIEWSGP